MAKKIVKFFFIFFLLLFPLGALGRFVLGNNVAVNISDICLVIVVMAWVITQKGKILLKTRLTKPIFLFIGVCLLSLLINSSHYSTSQLFVASLYLVRWVCYAALYFIVAGFDAQFKKNIVKLMTGVGSVIVAGGYVQYFFYPNLRNLFYAGWDEHLYRMFSSFLDPNFAGAFFVLYLLLLAELFSKKPFILGIVSALTLGAIFLTYSRSAYIMLLVCLAIFFVLKKKSHILTGFILMLAIVLILLSKPVQSEGTNLLRTTSSLARIDEARNAIAIFKDHPIFGVGFNTYRYAQYKYGFIKAGDAKGAISNHAGAGTDNSFLFILATTGIIGFSAYMYLWYRIIKVKRDSIFSILMFSCAIGLFMDALFINSLFYPPIMSWMWILIGLRESR